MLQYNNSNNNFDEVFINNDLDNLDRMARDINKKKHHYKDISNDINNNEKTTLKGIEAFSNEPNFSFSPQSNFYDKNGNYKSDFFSGLPTPLDEISIDKSEKSFALSSNKYSTNSDNIESFDDISSEYTLLPKKKKKHLRLNNEHLKDYSESDDKLILKHIQNCEECKDHLLNLLKNENHFISSQKNPEIINTNKETEKNFEINYKELKDVIILIIIGIIIIFVLDIFLRR
jgi:hypothetical protein